MAGHNLGGVAVLVQAVLPPVHNIGRFEVSFDQDGSGGVDVQVRSAARLEWSLSLRPDRPFVAIAAGPFAVLESSGNFKVVDEPSNQTTWQTIDHFDPRPLGLSICGSVGDTAGEAGRYNLTLSSNGRTERGLDFALSASTTRLNRGDYNRLYLSWYSEADEQFFGLGEQYTVHGLRGRQVPIFTTEQGVGRGAQPVSDYVDAASRYHNAAGNWHTTYTAIGHYITSRLRSVETKADGFLTLDLATPTAGATTVTACVAAPSPPVGATRPAATVSSMEGTVFHGASPDEIVQ
eukprot:153324-Prymnesium_polylepis.1